MKNSVPSGTKPISLQPWSTRQMSTANCCWKPSQQAAMNSWRSTSAVQKCHRLKLKKRFVSEHSDSTSFLFCVALHLRTKVFSRCSTQWLTSCQALSTLHLQLVKTSRAMSSLCARPTRMARSLHLHSKLLPTHSASSLTSACTQEPLIKVTRCTTVRKNAKSVSVVFC
ncbi:unannotated protein [freshwater metagenome]|uniref:Unannotated protein n=1 Tax=freshwater metagenome TaxID=449393 RepID=A0A6J7RM87_9ZZZZ